MILTSNGILELAVQVNREVVGKWGFSPDYAMAVTQVMALRILDGQPEEHRLSSRLHWTPLSTPWTPERGQSLLGMLK